MEIDIKEENGGYKIEFKKVSKTFVHLLKEQLKESDDVEEVAILKTHPYLENPKLWLRTKSKKPSIVIKESIKELINIFGELEKKFLENF